MSARAYLLLDIVQGSSEYATKMLRSWPGVVFADRLEGHPDIVALVTAPTREMLAEAIMPVIGCIDVVTEDFRLMVTPDDQVDILPPARFKNSKPKVRKN